MAQVLKQNEGENLPGAPLCFDQVPNHLGEVTAGGREKDKKDQSAGTAAAQKAREDPKAPTRKRAKADPKTPRSRELQIKICDCDTLAVLQQTATAVIIETAEMHVSDLMGFGKYDDVFGSLYHFGSQGCQWAATTATEGDCRLLRAGG